MAFEISGFYGITTTTLVVLSSTALAIFQNIAKSFTDDINNEIKYFENISDNFYRELNIVKSKNELVDNIKEALKSFKFGKELANNTGKILKSVQKYEDNLNNYKADSERKLLINKALLFVTFLAALSLTLILTKGFFDSLKVFFDSLLDGWFLFIYSWSFILLFLFFLSFMFYYTLAKLNKALTKEKNVVYSSLFFGILVFCFIFNYNFGDYVVPLVFLINFSAIILYVLSVYLFAKHTFPISEEIKKYTKAVKDIAYNYESILRLSKTN